MAVTADRPSSSARGTQGALPAVPGLVALRPLAGATWVSGDWLARREADASLVAAVAVSPEVAARADDLGTQQSRSGGVGEASPGLLPVTRVLGHDGRPVLVRPWGTTLAAALSRSPLQVVDWLRVLADVAEGIAALPPDARASALVAADRVLAVAGGWALDPVPALHAAPTRSPTGADTPVAGSTPVGDLVALVRRGLAEQEDVPHPVVALVAAPPPDPARLAAAARAMLDDGPSRRPARPQPTSARPPATRHRRLPLRVLLLAVALLAAAVAAGVLWGRASAVPAGAALPSGGAATAAPAGDVPAADSPAGDVPAADVPDPLALVRSLDRARVGALARLDAEGLAAVATGAALAADRSAVAGYRAAGVRPLVTAPVVERVTVEQVGADRLVLQVVDERRAYRVVSVEDGGVVEHVPASGPRTWRVTLQLTAGGWKVATVTGGARQR